MNFKICTRRNLRMIWVSGIIFVAAELLIAACFG